MDHRRPGGDTAVAGSDRSQWSDGVEIMGNDAIAATILMP
jgi:hypothetical protein